MNTVCISSIFSPLCPLRKWFFVKMCMIRLSEVRFANLISSTSLRNVVKWPSIFEWSLYIKIIKCCARFNYIFSFLQFVLCGVYWGLTVYYVVFSCNFLEKIVTEERDAFHTSTYILPYRLKENCRWWDSTTSKFILLSLCLGVNFSDEKVDVLKLAKELACPGKWQNNEMKTWA